VRVIPLIAPPLHSYTPEEYREYVRSLYERPEGTTPVSGMKIIFGEKVTQVRFDKGKEKKLSKKEVKVLAEFYEKTEEELLELFGKRKVEVI